MLAATTDNLTPCDTGALRNTVVSLTSARDPQTAEYPSAAAFAAIVMSPEVTEIGVHRAAGLEGQLLIQVSQLAL
jgi:hypothetical protein